MKLTLRQLPRLLLLSAAIFGVVIVLNLVLGNAVTWGTNTFIQFLFTTLYTLALYYANAVTFQYLDKVFESNRFSIKRMILGFVLSFIISVGTIFLLRVFEEVVVNNNSFAIYWEAEKAQNYLFAIVITFFITLSLYAFYFYKAYQETRLQEQKVIAGTASAKFESLKNQIDPHFLFNSLNVLSSLIEENPENAQRFTISLSKVYRYVLEQKDKEVVSVSEELAFAKVYLNLLKMRFENSLSYELPEFPVDTNLMVVPLSLQLLLENAVKHNVVSDLKPLHVKITIEGNELVVKNDLQKKEVLGSNIGVGLQNIVSRYSIITNRKLKVLKDEQTFEVRLPILSEITRQDMDVDDFSAYRNAEKKMLAIKGFYSHLISYIVVISGLAILNLVTSPGYLWFLWPALGWGIGLAIHGFGVFNFLPFVTRSWEKRKIQEYYEIEKLKKFK